MGLHDEAKLDQKFMELAKLMNVHLNHFPKHEKYGLALEIRRAAYDVYSFIVEAQKRYHKKTAMTNLDVRHEQLRMLVRLAYTMGYFEFKDGKRAEKSPEAQGEPALHPAPQCLHLPPGCPPRHAGQRCFRARPRAPNSLSATPAAPPQGA